MKVIVVSDIRTDKLVSDMRTDSIVSDMLTDSIAQFQTCLLIAQHSLRYAY